MIGSPIKWLLTQELRKERSLFSPKRAYSASCLLPDWTLHLEVRCHASVMVMMAASLSSVLSNLPILVFFPEIIPAVSFLQLVF